MPALQHDFALSFEPTRSISGLAASGNDVVARRRRAGSAALIAPRSTRLPPIVNSPVKSLLPHISSFRRLPEIFAGERQRVVAPAIELAIGAHEFVVPDVVPQIDLGSRRATRPQHLER